MNIKNITIALLLTFSLSSFIVKENTINQSLTGIWVFENYGDKEMSYQKKADFKRDKPGIEFKENGKLVKRQNVGWCGTPPISYGNFDGTWSMKTDSIISIRYEYWGGEIEEDWKIMEVSKKDLIVKMTRSETFKRE